ncbi:MAG: DnaJ domain-containing protein [Proteobacteria bacterium]|nr:DnaJ domain-containing protein [Pseudomonadota bacterium]MBU1641271.1 DnaJ domain-containing protein [Pseudomonadota bacterium]
MDYYKILGVDKSADSAAIKKAYRKLAMKYHPDKTAGDKAAEEKFKEANEAYAVLSDPEKRKQYDTYGSTGFSQRYSQEDIFRGSDLGSILREFGINFGGGFSQGGGSPFESFFSQSSGGGSRGFQQQPAKGQDMIMELWVTLEEVATGTERTIALAHIGDRVSVKIPPGIESGKKLRVTGKGAPSQTGGPAGDLYLKINVQPHSLFQQEGSTLIYEVKIPFSQAALGTKVAIPTMDGKELNVKIPAGMQAGGKLRLQGKGLPKGPKGPHGDLMVKINIEVPKELSAEQKKLLKELQKIGL